MALPFVFSISIRSQELSNCEHSKVASMEVLLSGVRKSSAPMNMLDCEIIDVAYSVIMIWRRCSMRGWNSPIHV